MILSSYRPGGIPARSERGERLLLFIGIIDILQSYRLKKKLEHTFKSIIHDGVSVHGPLSNVRRLAVHINRYRSYFSFLYFRIRCPYVDHHFMLSDFRILWPKQFLRKFHRVSFQLYLTLDIQHRQVLKTTANICESSFSKSNDIFNICF